MKALILPPLSALYSAVTRSRTALYQRGAFRSSKLPRPVISVGNITAGGTGKTPLVEWVARKLANNGRRVCILTRGYGRADSKRRVLVSDGKQIFSNPVEAGDEPYLLARNLTGVAAVICDAKRVLAGAGAIKHLGTDCFVLDDGFQHLQLSRDLDVVTIDATNPFGGRKLLPLGLLREPLKSLRRADCIVLTRCDQVEDVSALSNELARLSDNRPIFKSRMKTRRLVGLEGEEPTSGHGQVAAFCGVGNPESFFSQLRLSGYEVAFRKAFPDHHNYSQLDIDGLVTSAQQAGAESLITTAKDAIKLHELRFQIPCYSLEVEIEFEQAAAFESLLIGIVNQVAS